jgi:hypothetical protein
VTDNVWRPATGVEYRVWQDPYGWVARCVVQNYGPTKVAVALFGLSETEAEAKAKCESDWKKRSISPCKESSDAPALQ